MKFILSIFIFLFTADFCHSQTIDEKIKKYKCGTQIDSIALPSNFFGPKYEYYTEGSLIYFWTKEKCLITILCGSNAELTLDSSYYEYEEHYYNPIIDRYARKIVNDQGSFIQYENVNKDLKNKLDLLFDKIRLQ